MQYLWSPWRMEYILNPKSNHGCVFCDELARPDGLENLIVTRWRNAFIILNRYPYTTGHLMVVPYVHQPSLEFLTTETRAEMMELSSACIEVLRNEYRPEGFNLGVNIGEAAGAGITSHFHMHIVPRWGGDTNFMSSLAQVRVIPEALEATSA